MYPSSYDLVLPVLGFKTVIPNHGITILHLKFDQFFFKNLSLNLQFELTVKPELSIIDLLPSVRNFSPTWNCTPLPFFFSPGKAGRSQDHKHMQPDLFHCDIM